MVPMICHCEIRDISMSAAASPAIFHWSAAAGRPPSLRVRVLSLRKIYHSAAASGRPSAAPAIHHHQPDIDGRESDCQNLTHA